MLSPEIFIFINDIATDAPNNSKIMDTVVDVGNQKVLKRSSKIISAIPTAKNIIITSENVKWPG